MSKKCLEKKKFGIKNFKTYQKFAEKVYKIRENVLINIKKLKENNKHNWLRCASQSNYCFEFWYYKRD